MYFQVIHKLDADSHVYQLLLSKLQMGNPTDFDSRLYMCTEAFDYMDSDTLGRLSQSGLLLVYALGVLLFSVSSLKIFLKPVEYKEEEKEDMREYMDRYSTDWDNTLLYNHYERMNQDISHIDSEIQKVAQLVAGDREDLEQPIHNTTHQSIVEEEDNEQHMTDNNKPHNDNSNTPSHTNSVQELPSLVDEKPDLIFFIG